MAIEACLAVMRKAINRALEGNVSAMKLDLPRIETYKDFLKASNCIIYLMAQGIISPPEAMELSHVYSQALAMWDVVDLSQRVKALEKQAAQMQGKPYMAKTRY